MCGDVNGGLDGGLEAAKIGEALGSRWDFIYGLDMKEFKEGGVGEFERLVKEERIRIGK